MASEVVQLLHTLAALMPPVPEIADAARKRLPPVESYNFSAQSALEESAARAARMLREGATVPLLSSLTDLSEDLIRKLVAKGEVYAIEAGLVTVVAGWQIRGKRLVRGFKAVLDALPDDLHPLEVEGFMRTEKDGLRMSNGRAMSPIDWIDSGRPSAEVVKLASAMDCW